MRLRGEKSFIGVEALLWVLGGPAGARNWRLGQGNTRGECVDLNVELLLAVATEMGTWHCLEFTLHLDKKAKTSQIAMLTKMNRFLNTILRFYVDHPIGMYKSHLSASNECHIYNVNVTNPLIPYSSCSLKLPLAPKFHTRSTLSSLEPQSHYCYCDDLQPGDHFHCHHPSTLYLPSPYHWHTFGQYAAGHWLYRTDTTV